MTIKEIVTWIYQNVHRPPVNPSRGSRGKTGVIGHFYPSSNFSISFVKGQVLYNYGRIEV